MDPEVLKERTDELLERTLRLEVEIEMRTREIESVKTFSRLATGGKRPDYRQFSDEELRTIFELGMTTPSFNDLPVDIGRNGMPTEDSHPYNYRTFVDMHGVPTFNYNDLSRSDLIEVIDSFLEHHNYDVDPMEIARAQDNMIEKRSMHLSGTHSALKERVKQLQEQQSGDIGQEYTDELLTEKINTSKEHLTTFEKKVKQTSLEVVQMALNQKLSSAQGKSPEEVHEIIEQAKAATRNQGLVGEDLDEVTETGLELNGIDLTGVDLSESDLTGIAIEAETLSKAHGLESVKGVSESTLELVSAFRTPEFARIKKYEAELDRLEKPGILDHLKAIRHGGIEGAKRHLLDKIDKAKIELTHKMDADLSAEVQQHDQASLERLEEKQEKLIQKTIAYREAKQTVKGTLSMEALSKTGIGGGMSQEDSEKLQKSREENLEIMSDNRAGHKKYKQNEKEIEALKKDISVRDKVGGRTKPEDNNPGRSVTL
ncbi:hypothetical protein [Roseimicrobium sp. ORNL1]|uniref:hypothetical protein n=1 Tax=Roseimicrobium sp. ORNL1 TaxID=2711231 RepID=UPI0013E1EE0E|nr:hypothetical protein [Roseimicrobium sp. ORNL1]QIF04066.1 hypothetical protein G5S37_21890 [Roseimicrobium sp. ORNL1]